MKSYMCSRARSHMMKCGPGHTTTCTCHFEADAPLGRDLMSTKTQNQPTNSTLNQPSSWRTWSHCRRTRLWLRIHTSLRYISMMLAMRYQTCRPTPKTFPTQIWTALFESLLAKHFDMPRP